VLRLGARGTQSLRICLRLILEPRVSQNRTRHRRGKSPGMERNRVRDTQAVCGFRYLASNATPFFPMPRTALGRACRLPDYADFNQAALFFLLSDAELRDVPPIPFGIIPQCSS
jgi:hypothetical protein